ncbi:hypothetical protein DFQ30_008789 [Apophysomyces sp. BC1015]|nr:hypothetical protein DFQ30_008789 [Apophysomyces sp. BC1015]KAG0183349.1 hypothetical protein DFQ29_006918 [Apophysomyces sp. BC1021]
MAGKGVVRSIKNYAKGFSDVQIKVREATSNDAWGPSGTLMNEIAQLTYNQQDFIEVMDMVDKRLNDKGKNWRHVFKALLLLDYCLHVGSENVVLYAKENVYVVKTLKEFQHIDENGTDVGVNVRQKAKDITNLLTDDARLRDERRQRQQMRDRMGGVTDYLNETITRNAGPSGNGGTWDDENELRKAIEESKRVAEAEEKKRQQGDTDLEKAIRISEQEASDKARKEREKLEQENQNNLFGGTNAQTSSFNPFPQNQTFDAAFNPYAQQQQQQQQQLQLQQQQQLPQNTGFSSMAFSDPVSANQQQLNYQNTGFASNPYQQTNPYQQQQLSTQFGQGLQAQMTGMPQQTQFTGMAPFQPSTMTGMQQQPQFANNAPFQTSMVTGASNNPFGQSMDQQHQQQQQQFGFAQHLSASPTVAHISSTAGQSARSFSFPSPQMGQQQQQQQQQQHLSPSLSFTATNSTATQSRSRTLPSSPSFTSTTITGTSSEPRQTDERYAHLNSLLASREDGMDTFGNTGNLRIPFGSGFANSLQPAAGNKTSADLLNIGNGNAATESPSSSFAEAFGQQPSRNPFGQTNQSSWTSSPKVNNQKSLLELMQEQKQQQMQMQVPQATGFPVQQQQPQQQQQLMFQQAQTTGFPASTGVNAFGQPTTGSFF